MNEQVEKLELRNAELEKEVAEKKRELEIEVALEKVRSRTMAMRHSNELPETAYLLFQQFKQLGEDPIQITIGIFNEKENSINFSITGGDGSGARVNKMFTASLDEPTLIHKFYTAWKENKASTAVALTGEPLLGWIKYRNEISGEYANYTQADPSEYRYAAAGFFSKGLLSFSKTQPLAAETIKILERFAQVFDLTYTRFLDLQKAEAQTREAKIEAALERVRSRTMAMQKSDELPETSSLLFQQVKELGETAIQNSIAIVNEEAGFVELSTTIHGSHVLHTLNVPIDDPFLMTKAVAAWKAKRKSLVLGFEGQELKDYNALRNSFLETKINFPEDRWIVNMSFFSKGWLSFSTNKNVPSEIVDVQKRFAAVFDQTYTRFLDLQKAEAQVREAKIEAALERVRSASLAMHRSDELKNVIIVVFQKLKELGLVFQTAGIQLFAQGSKDIIQWVASPNLLSAPVLINLPYTEEDFEGSEIVRDFLMAKETAKGIYNKNYSFDEKNNFFEYAGRCNNLVQLPEKAREAQRQAPGYTLTLIPERHSALWVDSYSGQTISIEGFDVLKRTAKVFEQAYTRFLDLQRAEAQAREAQIEAALERVRSRTMGMQKSEELTDVAAILFKQISDLGIKVWTTGFNIWSDDNNFYTDYITSPQGGFIEPYAIDATGFPAFTEVSDARKRGEEFFVSYLEGGMLKQTYLELAKFGDKQQYEKMLEGGFQFPDRQFNHFVFGSKVSLMFITYEPVLEAHAVFKRFGKVFEQTYTRFIDLQKAEAQVRESQIQLALERVRARTMAMQKSDELTDVATLLFKQVNELGIKTWTTGFNVWSDDDTSWMDYVTNPQGGFIKPYTIDATQYPLNEVSGAKKRGDEFFVRCEEGEQLAETYRQLSKFGEKQYTAIMDSGFQFPTKQYEHFVFGSKVSLMFITYEPVPEAHEIFKRFGKVFEQTYTRFLDLQKAEASATEAIRQASVDRVRAEIASMRTTKDLERITPLIWNELTILNIPFFRCGVFIMKEEEQQSHIYLSTPDGKAIAAFNLAFNSDSRFIEGVVNHWRDNKIFLDHWDGETFTAWMHSLLEAGVIQADERYSNEKPPENLYLHFVPFAQGMLYVGNTGPLSEEALHLVQSLADAFATAYARYEDFKKLETAKQQIETTLSELKSAQALLVQSEKMASLGELTAGIAHEIQNPLNFVNNFSEVNQELLLGIKEDLANGDYEEVKSLVDDILSNEEKINHHGKRADSIVKGMLQHSRTSKGEKQLTDINALCEEYLRLSYHGLRAKDKSFNAKIETHFDGSINKINVVPQDIGRVLLNLFNNAFYTVNEKKKHLKETFEPIVTVATVKQNGSIVLKIADNGMGISKSLVDKIFQPFFTTKPTGQGTGLGLSLSYDIIKAHGGDIQVESKEGEGTAFTVSLPV